MMIGFDLKGEVQNTKNELSYGKIKLMPKKPIKSVVDVSFENGKSYPYYNEDFCLEVGDIVYVDGKLAGKPGVVTSVTTKFKVSLDYYKKVLRKLNTTFHGDFVKMNEFMVCSGKCAVNEKKADSWFKPPREEAEIFVSAEGYEAFFENGSIFTEADSQTQKEAVDILISQKVKLITVQNGKGVAYIKTDKGFEKVEFVAEKTKISGIFCECIKPGFCKHMEAVCLALMLFKTRNADLTNFTAMESSMFFFLASQKNKKISV